MSVNDLLCVGAKPLFFLDYFATGKLDLETSAAVIQGVREGCDRAGLLLVGGETAEMPGMYAAGEYDLAGFAVGLVHSKRALPRATGPRRVRAGQTLIGFRSSGFHSNGFSLIRKLVDDWTPADTGLAWAKNRAALLRELLAPTALYTDAILPSVEKGYFSGLAHITGSGFLNVPRMGEGVSYEIALPSSARLPRVYEWLRRAGAVTLEERLTTFNCGIGMIAAVDAKKVRAVVGCAERAEVEAFVLGEVVPRRRGAPAEVIVHAEGETHRLRD
jgi:phosphoribosylformylglycinamidine cyclo-ligase